MKKGEIYEGIVEKMDFPNKGIIYIEGERATVKNALPGQKVKFLVNKKRKGKCEGRLLEVTEPAAVELADACPHFGICGGCLFQIFPYEEQLKIKEGQVRELLEGVLGTPGVSGTWNFEGIIGSPAAERYRNKMEFSFGDEVKDGPLALGMHKRGSFYDVVTVGGCRIVHEDFTKILLCTKEFFEERQIPFYKKMQQTGYLRHLLVRRAVKTGEILIDLITTTQTHTLQTEQFGGTEEELLNQWREKILALSLEGTLAGILHTKNDTLADAVKDEGTEILFGQDYFYEELLGLKFRISPFSFFQTNSLGAEVLYEKTREYVGGVDGKVVFDLYSGTGTIAQILAPVAQKVVGVEIVEEAVEAARVNAERNGLSNCEFIAGDVLKVVGELTDKPDLIVLDPPRDGIHPKAIEKIIDFGVERMVYVSCKPTSLARDLEILTARGYAVERACCVDMFPRTGNVETVVLLSKGEIDSKKVRVEFSLEDVDMSGFQKGATYEQIKAYVLEKHGLKVSSLYISQVKRKCGLEIGQNYNLSKKEDAKVPQCPLEKEEVIIDALKHFQII